MTELSSTQRPRTAQRSGTELSFQDRLYIIQTVNGLPPAQFDELCFALNPPKGIVPANTASQGERSKALLDWSEGSTGPGLEAVDQGLQAFVPKITQPEQSPQPKAFAVSGNMGDLSPAELEAIVQLLRQKTGDDSITLAFYTEGSIKLVLNGSPEGLNKLQELFDSGELTNVLDGWPVEYVHSIERNTTEARKSRLLQVLRLNTERTNLTLALALARDLTLARDLALALALDRDRDLARNLDLARDLARNLARNLALALARDRVRNLDRVRVRVRNLDLDLVRARALDPDLARALGQDLARDRIRNLDLDLDGDLALAPDLDGDLALALDLARNLDRALALALARNRARNLDLDLELELELDLALDLARNLDLDLDRDLGQDLDLELELELDRALELDRNINLRHADLRGANLKDLDLRGIDLEGTDLTDADVTKTLFGDNPGLTDSDKRDLQRRGAVFLDPPSSDVPSLVLR